MSKVILSLRNLRVDFITRRGVRTALNDVSFEIAEGEILGVVGESGAGKSLAGLAAICLIDPPGRISDGEVLLSGERIDGLSERNLRGIRGKRIGMAFQDPWSNLNPFYRIGDQIITTMRSHDRISRRSARHTAVELLAEVGIAAPERRIDAYPHELSGGMRQRAALALALCASPQILIADEPTTALDVSVQAQVLTLFKTLCRDRKMAIMLISHDMSVIAEAADRVVVMYAGRVIESGPVQDVLQKPLHPYTLGLMGAIPPISRKVERLTRIPGSMPRLEAIPQGCPFNPRCPRVFARCRELRPDLQPKGSHAVACHLFDDQTTI